MSVPAIDVVLPSTEQIAELCDADLDRALWEAEASARKIEAFRAAVVNRAEATNRAAADGHRSTRSWMMAVTNCSPGEATKRVRLARLTRSWPELAEELAAARVGVAQVHELARLAANPRCGELLPTSGAPLIDAAKQLEFVDFRTVARRWEQLADSDGAFKDHEASLEQRNVSIVEIDGEFEIRGRMPGVHGTILNEIFSKFCEAEFHADAERARIQHGAASKDRLDRTAAQRRADALLKIFETAATAGINAKPIDVCVNLVIDEDQFTQYLRHAIDATPVEIDPVTVIDRRCETSDGVPVDPRHAVALALVGHVRRVVFNSKGVVTNAGRRTRLYRGAIRTILQSIDPRCMWLGCMIRAAVSHLDHLQGYAHGGTTDTANGRTACGFHNLFKHRNGYQPQRDPQGNWHLHRPDGTPIQPPDTAA